MSSVNIVIDGNNPVSPRVATYLAESIRTTGSKVSIYTVDEIVDGRSSKGISGIEAVSGDQIISLTPSYRPDNSSKVVYWLDSRSFGIDTQLDSLFAKFKQAFVDLMSFNGIRGQKVFVGSQGLKDRLLPYVRGGEVLRFPPAFSPKVLPGKYGRSIAFEFGSGFKLEENAFGELLSALDLQNIEEFVFFGADEAHVEKLRKGLRCPPPNIVLANSLEEFSDAMARGLSYVGIGIDQDSSFERISTSAALMRPVVFFSSSVDNRYFVNQVTGFEVVDFQSLGNVLKLLSAGEIDSQLVGECLCLHFMKKYNPEVVLMEALK